MFYTPATLTVLVCVCVGVAPQIEECLQSLRLYDFLWQQDMHATCKQLLSSGPHPQPRPQDCSAHIENFMILEDKISSLRSVFSVGPLQLSSQPVKNSLRALAVAWKIEFVSYLHRQGKVRSGSWLAGYYVCIQ